MFRPGRGRLRRLPVNSLAPNILTTLALCSGLTSIRFALLERWQLAVAAIVVAAIFDALDGRLARLLKGASRFGAELDSLSDFISFGVAPVILLYLWSLNGIGNVGWVVVLVFSVCCALRLARFNVAIDDPQRPAWAGSFFTGVPAPAAAGLSILFVLASFEAGDVFFRSPWLNGFWALVVAFLMVSRLPTYSFKRVRVPRDMVLPTLLVVGLLAALLAAEPWYTLLGIALVYLAMLPFSALSYARQRGQRPWPIGPEEPAQPASGATVAPLPEPPAAEPERPDQDRRLH